MKSLRKLLNINVEEEGKIYLLLALGFFIGISNVTFLVQSSSAFLSAYDEKKDLPIAIIASGVLGVISAGLFSFFQNRISFSRIAITVLSLILFFVTCIRLGYDYTPFDKAIIFISFVLIGPFNAMTTLVFWGIVGRLFSLKQAKKIIGSIDSGQLIGTIITSFTIPAILSVMINSNNLISITALSMVMTFFIFLLIYRKYPLELTKDKSEVSGTNVYKFEELIKNKYVLAMAIFIIVSTIATIFVNYSFLQVTARNYPDARDLASFLAKFEGTILIFSFLVQTFVTDKLISLYGLKITLLVTPIVVLLFAIIASMVGLVLEYGALSNTFILFFLAISLSKLFITALKDAIDGPTFKLYFLPFDSLIRLDVQTKIEGVVKLFAELIAGLILITIGIFQVFSLMHISLFLIIIIVSWMLIASKMHKKYKEALQNTLSNLKRKVENDHKSEFALSNLLNEELESANTKKILHTLKLIEKLRPAILEEALNKVILKGLPDLKDYASNKLSNIQLKDVKHYSSSNGSPGKLKISSKEYGNSVNGMDAAIIDPGNLKKLVKSKIIEDRILAANLLRNNKNPEGASLLNELLKDADAQVVTAAIYSAKYLKQAPTWPLLIDLLGVPAYSNLASAALIDAGDEVIASLDVAFQKSGQDENIMTLIIQIYGQMGSPKAIDKLWEKLGYQDIRIVSQILRAFSFLKVKAKGKQVVLINDVLENEIRKTAWNISAQSEIGQEEFNEPLKQALQEEIDLNFNIIFILLSLIYDEQSIQLVRDNIESGTNEGRVFAMELLDIFLAKDVKTILFPLLDDVPLQEKIRNLQVQFPRDIFNSVEVLKQIINRDYNNISRWTKACALYSYGLIPGAVIGDDLIANFFNPNNLLRETAAWAVVRNDKVMFKDVLSRIMNQRKNKMDDALTDLAAFEGGKNKKVLRIEKIMFLKRLELFKNVPGYILSELVDEIKEITIKEGTEVISEGSSENVPVFIVYKGSINFYKGGRLIEVVTENGILGEMQILDSDLSGGRAVANEDLILLSISKLKLYEFMTKYYQMAYILISGYNKRFEREEDESLLESTQV